MLDLDSNQVETTFAALNLIPKPEQFTELYFNNFADLSASLPAQIEPHERIAFLFTLHNLEGKDMTYPYVVYMVDELGATTTIAAGTTTLANGAVESVHAEYTFSALYTPKQVAIFVTLKNKDQSIDFFVPNKE